MRTELLRDEKYTKSKVEKANIRSLYPQPSRVAPRQRASAFRLCGGPPSSALSSSLGARDDLSAPNCSPCSTLSRIRRDRPRPTATRRPKRAELSATTLFLRGVLLAFMRLFFHSRSIVETTLAQRNYTESESGQNQERCSF